MCVCVCVCMAPKEREKHGIRSTRSILKVYRSKIQEEHMGKTKNDLKTCIMPFFVCLMVNS